MAYTTTTRLGLKKAVVGSNQAFETAEINANWDKVDAEAIDADSRLDALVLADTALDTRVDVLEAAAAVGGAINVQTGTTYTLSTGDVNDTIQFTSADPVTFTVADVFTGNQYVNFAQWGAGAVTVVAASGVTLRSLNGLVTSGQYAFGSIIRMGSAEYGVVGALVA